MRWYVPANGAYMADGSFQNIFYVGNDESLPPQ